MNTLKRIMRAANTIKINRKFIHRSRLGAITTLDTKK